MILETTDLVVILLVLGISVAVGLWASRGSGRTFNDYFLSGGKMPWWLLGMSMVATTFAADTPNLVTEIVRKNGIGGNWVWWSFLLTGLLTVFLYAKLWKRSGLKTDLEFYEMRYSGPAASFLRGFRAVYLGVVFNCIIMATVLLAGIKIGGILMGLSPLQVVLYASVITVIYTMVGGLKAVIYTDFFQFAVAMVGAVGAAIYVVGMPEVGGWENVMAQTAGHSHFLPDLSQPDIYIPLLLVPLAVQWWASWYPGAEPGGGGYIAQRMLSAKSESHAVKATLFFNLAHYALRPWPWIVVALASLVVFPDLESIQRQFPNLDAKIIQDDMAYPAMLSFLPQGLLGIVVASLVAAFMSTISTHLNWGASYLTHDVYKRFLQPAASERQQVSAGRIATMLLMAISALLALVMESALDSFHIILQIGAGTGLVYILRWFWWRVNAYTEISAMMISFVLALVFEFSSLGDALADYQKFLLIVAISTVGWLLTTFLTRPTDMTVLQRFYQKVRPDAWGWQPVAQTLGSQAARKEIRYGIAAMFLGACTIYATLFGMGYLLYGQWMAAGICLLLWLVGLLGLRALWKKVVA